ncbi:hypothetical protein Tco_1271725 [Tanacetum coccineum]
MSLLPLMMLWFRGGGTGSHLGHPHHQDNHHLMTHLHHYLSFPLLLLLPYPGLVDGQRFFSDLMRLFLFVDLTTPICMGRVRLIQDHQLGLHHLESSLDSNFERSLDSSLLSVGPSRKRCRAPTTSVPSSTHVLRLIATTHADLLPPRKRFRDSYSLEDSREEHMEIGTANAEAVADLGIGDGVGAHTEDGIGMTVEIAVSDIREDEEEFKAEESVVGTREIIVDPLVTGGISESTKGDVPDLEDTIYDIVHYMSEVPLDRITEFETSQR